MGSHWSCWKRPQHGKNHEFEQAHLTLRSPDGPGKVGGRFLEMTLGPSWGGRSWMARAISVAVVCPLFWGIGRDGGGMAQE